MNGKTFFHGLKVVLKIFFLLCAFISHGYSQQTAQLNLMAKGPVKANQPFWIDINIEGVTDLFGLSLKLHGKHPSLVYLDGSGLPGQFLGTAVLSFFQKVNEQTVDIAISKTSGEGGSGSGIVARVQFMASCAIIDTMVAAEVLAMDRNGVAIPLAVSSLILTIPDSVISNQPTITLVSPQQINVDEPFWIDIKVGETTEVKDLFGISFKLKSKNANLSYVDGSASAGAIFGSSAISFFQKVNEQTVDIGLSKTSGGGITGSGIVAKVQYKARASLVDSIIITDISAVDQNGNPITLLCRGNQITVRAANHKPILSRKSPNQKIDSVTAASTINFGVTATDPDGDPLTYKWMRNNDLIKSGPDTQFSYTFSSATIGTVQTITCIFADQMEAKDSVVWTFKIVKSNPLTVNTSGSLPKEITLGGNYPNPFNPSTTIMFDLPKDALVSIGIYNLLGKRVRTLIDGNMMNASLHTVTWDARDDIGLPVSSGIYLCRFTSGKFDRTIKMLFTK